MSMLSIPLPPGNFVATPSTSSRISLSWVASADTDGYLLYRLNADTGNYDRIGGFIRTTTYLDTGLHSNQEYSYRIAACNKCGISEYAVSSATTLCEYPSPPYGLMITGVTETTATLQWTLPAGTPKPRYIVYQGLNSWSMTAIATTAYGDSSYVVTGLTRGTTYYFQIFANNGCLSSYYGSNIVSDTTDCITPDPASLLDVTVLSTTEIMVEWAPIDGATAYQLERRKPPIGGWLTLSSSLPLTPRTYTDTGLEKETEYCYRLKAIGNECGDGEYSVATCRTTMAVPLCNTPEQTFAWNREVLGAPPPTGETLIAEPGIDDSILSDSVYIRHSAAGSIDVSDPSITKVVFDEFSFLDDILIMYHPDDEIVETFITGPNAKGRGDTHYQLPERCILFGETSGCYINGAGVSHLWSTEKRFSQTTTGYSHTVLAGPPGGAGIPGTGHLSDFMAAGFETAYFSDGIDKSRLQAMGFIDENGIFRFRFAHIICGSGFANIRHMTCYSNSSSSSSPDLLEYLFNEGTGSIGTDTFDYHTNGTISDPVWSNCILETADGAHENAITAVTPQMPTGANPWTISMWIETKGVNYYNKSNLIGWGDMSLAISRNRRNYGLELELLMHEDFGTTVADTSDNGTDGTINGATWDWSNLSFGLLSSVTGPSTNMPTTGDFSVAAWIYLDANSTPGRANIVGWGDFSLYHGYDSGYVVGVSFGGTNYDLAHEIPLSTWTHIVAVKTGSSVNLYINNVLSGTLTGGVVTGGGFVLGGNAGGIYLDGYISNVQVYSRAIDEYERGLLYQNGDGYSPYVGIFTYLELYTTGPSRTFSKYLLTYSDGTWYHVMLTYDGVTVKLYLNDPTTPIVEQAASLNIVGTNTTILGQVYNDWASKETLDAYIKKVRVYGYALYEDERTALFEDGADPDCSMQCLLEGLRTPETIIVTFSSVDGQTCYSYSGAYRTVTLTDINRAFSLSHTSATSDIWTATTAVPYSIQSYSDAACTIATGSPITGTITTLSFDASARMYWYDGTYCVFTASVSCPCSGAVFHNTEMSGESPTAQGAMIGIHGTCTLDAIYECATVSTEAPAAMVVQGLVNHYSATETVSWHLEMELTEVDDIDFLTPKISVSSASSQTRWSYRLDEFGATGDIVALPIGGITTHKSLGRNRETAGYRSTNLGHTDYWTATAFYTLSSSDLSLLIKDKQYLMRIRQYDGSNWGNWLTAVVRA